MKTVQILISTYNGEVYLRDQLDSLLKQKGVKTQITVRDDGSNDSTTEILNEYYQNGHLEYFSGPNIGYRKSFLWLANQRKDSADYYAFCDQDDYWEPEKLLKAIELLEKYPNEKYKLYFSNLKIVDENLNEVGIKNYSDMPLTLGCCLVRSNVAGCTMVFNNELLKLSLRRENIINDVFSHDGWIYKVCLSIGGKIIFDVNSYIKYRQHNNNVTGIRQGITKRLKSEINSFTINKNIRSKSAKIIYDEYYELIPKEDLILLSQIYSYKISFLKTLKLLINRELTFGRLPVDIVTKISILLRKY